VQNAKLNLYADTNKLVVDKDKKALEHKIVLVMKKLEAWFLITNLF
jgi:hypothetical protein